MSDYSPLPSTVTNEGVGLPGIPASVLGTAYQPPAQGLFFTAGGQGIAVSANASIEQAQMEIEVMGLPVTIVDGALKIKALDFEDFEIYVEPEFEADLAAMGFVPTLVEAERQPTGIFADLYLTKQTMLLIGSSYPTGAILESALLDTTAPHDFTAGGYIEFTISVDQADPVTLRIDEAVIIAADFYNPASINLTEISGLMMDLIYQSTLLNKIYVDTRGGSSGRFVMSGSAAGSDHSVELQNFVDTVGIGMAFPDTLAWGKDRLYADQRFFEAETELRDLKDRLEAAGIP